MNRLAVARHRRHDRGDGSARGHRATAPPPNSSGASAPSSTASTRRSPTTSSARSPRHRPKPSTSWPARPAWSPPATPRSPSGRSPTSTSPTGPCSTRRPQGRWRFCKTAPSSPRSRRRSTPSTSSRARASPPPNCSWAIRPRRRTSASRRGRTHSRSKRRLFRGRARVAGRRRRGERAAAGRRNSRAPPAPERPDADRHPQQRTQPGHADRPGAGQLPHPPPRRGRRASCRAASAPCRSSRRAASASATRSCRRRAGPPPTSLPPQPTSSSAPPTANLYLEPRVARELAARSWALLQNPQRSAADAGDWVWVNGELLIDATLQVTNGGAVIAEEPLTAYDVEQVPGRQLGYDVVTHDPEGSWGARLRGLSAPARRRRASDTKSGCSATMANRWPGACARCASRPTRPSPACSSSRRRPLSSARWSSPAARAR